MSEVFRFDAAVIGAGVVGLALARALAMRGNATILLEACDSFGMGISSRSSEVIHAGMYYVPGSNKARWCAPGNRMLYEYCIQRGVAHRRCGKWIVACDQDEVAKLDAYLQCGVQNGAQLNWLSKQQLQAGGDGLRAVAGLESPNTGIIDSHGLMFSLLTDFENAGGTPVFGSPVLSAARGGGMLMLQLGGRSACTIEAERVFNAAGMGAQAVAAAMADMPRDAIPGLYYAIGHYFALRGKAPFSRLIYPVAVAGGLGTHLTLDLNGGARFGPDVAWREREDYSFDESRVPEFYRSIRRWWPNLPDDALQPAYTGIRPKLFGPAQADQDFCIQTVSRHGVPGWVNLFGIESPGLTASLAMAQELAELDASSTNVEFAS